MPHVGFVKLHRKILDWEWYTDISAKVLFLHCLLKANYEDSNWKGIKLSKGQFVTSIASLAEETGLTQRQVRTSLNKLKMTGEVTRKVTSQYSIITINRWDMLQAVRQTECQASDNRVTTVKEYKEEKEKKKEKNVFSFFSKNSSFTQPDNEEESLWFL